MLFQDNAINMYLNREENQNDSKDDFMQKLVIFRVDVAAKSFLRHRSWALWLSKASFVLSLRNLLNSSLF